VLGGWVGTVGSCMRARSAAAPTHRLVDIELAAHGWLFAACLDCVCYTRNPPSKPAASRAASRPASALVLALCDDLVSGLLPGVRVDECTWRRSLFYPLVQGRKSMTPFKRACLMLTPRPSRQLQTGHPPPPWCASVRRCSVARLTLQAFRLGWRSR